MTPLKTAFVRQFWNGTRLASPAHTTAPDDRGHGLAVVAGLLGATEWPAVKAVLAGNTAASPYMEKYILESYFRMADPQGALTRMRARYEPMIRVRRRRYGSCGIRTRERRITPGPAVR